MKAQTLSGLYGLVVFLSAAVLLILEIVAGRLLAPYIGVSLYTWTSIIGVILAGLSLGHWIGGRLADNGAGHVAAGAVLIVAALATLAVLPLLLLVGTIVQDSEIGLLNASFIYVLTLFFLPAAAIGVISPLLTTLALKLERNPGSVVGRMHALSAV
ncbi:MAG: fused MFS/spermidine synthase, partial [Gammaproteobacteria bacterium]|nr:fused MFS/spermidine synthase [Gammaproteobacteria bacterium]